MAKNYEYVARLKPAMTKNGPQELKPVYAMEFVEGVDRYTFVCMTKEGQRYERSILKSEVLEITRDLPDCE